MQVKEIMTPNVETAHPDFTIMDTARIMQRLGVGILPVVKDKRIVGMVSDRDITIRSTAAGRHPWNTRVRDAMTSEVIYCYEDQNVEEAAKVMKEHRVRRLLVCNRGQQMVGIVSLDDVAGKDGDHDLAGEVLEKVSKEI